MSVSRSAILLHPLDLNGGFVPSFGAAWAIRSADNSEAKLGQHPSRGWVIRVIACCQLEVAERPESNHCDRERGLSGDAAAPMIAGDVVAKLGASPVWDWSQADHAD